MIMGRRVMTPRYGYDDDDDDDDGDDVFGPLLMPCHVLKKWF